MTELRDYLDAAKLDIVEHLEKPKVGVFEFRRIASIATVVQPLITSAGTPSEHHTIASVMSNAEDVAPHLHEALLKRAFNNQALLRQKYEVLSEQHRQLKLAALGIQDAQQKIALERQELDAQGAALQAHEEVLTRERERLQLEARARGREIVLPELPRLRDPDSDEDEDGETEES